MRGGIFGLVARIRERAIMVSDDPNSPVERSAMTL